jgi:hypothetical protein
MELKSAVNDKGEKIPIQNKGFILNAKDTFFA